MFVRVLLFGAGLIGGSIALALQRAGHDVHVVDPSQHVCARATADGLTASPKLADVRTPPQVVILAGPTHANIPNARVCRDAFPSAVMTDAGSVKGAIARELADDPAFVGGHPMAGRSAAGYDAADPELFRDAPWVLTPQPNTPLPTIATVMAIAIDAGARVICLPPDEHDARIAEASHLPHLLAVCEGLVSGRSIAPILAAGSFRDSTRVLESPPERTAEFLWENRAAVLSTLASASRSLDEIRGALTSSQSALEELFRDAQDARRLFDRSNTSGHHETASRVCADVDELFELARTRVFVTGVAMTPAGLKLTCQVH